MSIWNFAISNGCRNSRELILTYLNTKNDNRIGKILSYTCHVRPKINFCYLGFVVWFTACISKIDSIDDFRKRLIFYQCKLILNHFKKWLPFKTQHEEWVEISQYFQSNSNIVICYRCGFLMKKSNQLYSINFHRYIQ